ncbi:MAG TPA: SDR family oxidoreductase [Candidatus Lokiarchaeia archaeon]|nr:SDR family oxidoreductase [Candidatus Lokiarchaeia archaeon]
MNVKYYRGKNAVITGAASGIGRSFALQLASLGANLVISDINSERLTQVEQEIVERGGKVVSVVCDVTDTSQLANLAKISIEAYNDIHFLFSNVGMATGGFLPLLTPKLWDNIIRLNIWGMIYTINAFLPKMVEQGFGHIIQTSSIAGSLGVGGLSPYTTTKFAEAGFCEALYGEYFSKGIDVSIVCPFPLKTNLIENVGIGFPPGFLEDFSPEVTQEAITAGKSLYWEEFTKKSGVLLNGFGGGWDVDCAVKKYLEKIQKKDLYIFENRLGRLFQFLRGFSPSLYKKILRILGQRHTRLLAKTYQLATDKAKNLQIQQGIEPLEN